MAFQGFGKYSGPTERRGSQSPSFGNFPDPTAPAPPLPRPPSHLSQFQMVPGQNHAPPMAFPRDSFLDGPHSPYGEHELDNLTRSSEIHSNHLSLQAARFPIKHVDTQGSKRSRSPTNNTPFADDNIAFQDSRRDNLSRSSEIHSNHLNLPAATTVSGRFPIKHGDTQASKRSRSPTSISRNNTPFEDDSIAFHDSRRPYISASKMMFNEQSGSESHQEFSAPLRYNTAEIINSRKSFPIAKKTKLPSISSSDGDFHGASLSSEDESNRELDAKARRLLRFKAELSQPIESELFQKNQKGLFKRQQLPLAEGHELNGELPADMDSSHGFVLPDYDGMSSSSIIIGSCLDMCPESERSSRERKGDLDLYERVDGDRNQTSKSLAIKKYTRTAEREAELIRPMPILQKTMDYLLNLLDQPYDDSFLGLYNFLWDRMRAIRMDLRMQHIFSREALTMLEQMIRLHIIAMHELCEYTKGEGFAEGFDAHLNIEQMNKTSVELFQLYDDLRKNGVHVATEKEFRGFYALLKLDKHPGYKVEPAELSLDLAKMTPDMRQTPEVVFAREVARACRTGNYIAFFRLAQKATYLQACLMHAHFAKLRTQALAALHSGLQMNQGIPVVQVAKWLGMEEEDIGQLLEYHGFSLREFEVPYMVKEGPFLNIDSDYSVKCSRLVQRKKSPVIVQDVAYHSLAKPYPLKERTALPLYVGVQPKQAAIQSVKSVNTVLAVDEKMPDHVASPKTGIQKTPLHKLDHVASPKTAIQHTPMHTVATDKERGPSSPRILPPWNSSSSGDSQRYIEARFESPRNSHSDIHIRNSLDRGGQVDLKEAPSRSISGQVEVANTPSPAIESVMQVSVVQHLFEDREEYLGPDRESSGDEDVSTSNDEVFEAKLKLILRIWKRIALKKRASREHRKLLANAAITSLSLGLPISLPEIQPSPSGDFDIDGVVSNRFAIQEKSWAKLNVAEVVSAILYEKNPHSKCLCWKLLLCAEENSFYVDHSRERKEETGLIASSWLLSKLVPRRGDLDDHGDLSVSSSGQSIWKKWFSSCSGGEPTCCLTVVRETNQENVNEVVPGASAILFFLSGRICWEFQRNRLQNILKALLPGSQLPLLILSGSCSSGLDISTVVQELCLNDIDKSQISSYSVAFLNNQQMEQFNVLFDDDQLRKGLQWLACESSPQPVLTWIRTRELVQLHLNPSLEVLNSMNAHVDGPNSCINVFNTALDQSLTKIIAAVYANPSSWPCPEIAQLEECSIEYRAVSYYLPHPGWSLTSRIEPLVHILTECKLPLFDYDISWLYRGVDQDNSIKNQRTKLESILMNYFTELSQLMAPPFAKMEVPLILQKFVGLELRDTTHYIKPDWVKIFQRIFNWRLMELSNGDFSSAYILMKDNVQISTSGVVLNVTENSMAPFSFLVQPSFDEMVTVGCDTADSELLQLDHVIVHASSNIDKTPNIASNGDMEEDGDGKIVEQSGKCKEKDASEIAWAKRVKEKDDHLSALLERCNIVQNMIQEKLSIYF